LKAGAENKGKIREMETEPYPFHSQYVYRYTILEGPGFTGYLNRKRVNTFSGPGLM